MAANTVTRWRAATLAVALACCIATTAAFFQGAPPLAPGATAVTNTIDLFTFETRAPLFTFDFTARRTTDDGRFSLPDGVEFFAADAKCDFTPTTRFFDTFDAFAAFQRQRFFFDTPQFDAAGAFTEQFRDAARAMRQRDESLAFAELQCDAGFTFTNARPQFNPAAVAAIKRLPQFFDETNQGEFFQFFDTFAPFVITQCTPGGQLALFSFVDASFAEGTTPAFFDEQAAATIRFAVSGADKFRGQIDAGFAAHTTFSPLFARGGRFTTPGPDAWFDFTQFVKSGDVGAFQCTGFKAEPITAFFDFDESLGLAPWTDAFRQATFAFYTRPGCTNPAAFNFDRFAAQDDGTCFDFDFDFDFAAARQRG